LSEAMETAVPVVSSIPAIPHMDQAFVARTVNPLSCESK